MVTGTAMSQTPMTLTTNQKRGFLAAWGGWALDGMDSFIYALVLVPALTELLPNSGIAVNPANIGYYGSMLFALFLLGWGTSMVWGPIGDRIGRVRALMLTILCYSLFTFLCGFVTNIYQLAVLRFLCGIGIGGEQPVGATYIAEELDERTRKWGAGLMHTGYYFGFFFAAIANYFIGANYGWRWMFIFGGVPALMIAFIRFGVHESKKWQDKFGDAEAKRRPTMAQAFGALFTPAYKTATLVMSGLFTRLDHPALGGIDLRSDRRDAAGDPRRQRSRRCRQDRFIRIDCPGRSGRSSAASWCRRSPSASAGRRRWRCS